MKGRDGALEEGASSLSGVSLDVLIPMDMARGEYKLRTAMVPSE